MLPELRAETIASFAIRTRLTSVAVTFCWRVSRRRLHRRRPSSPTTPAKDSFDAVMLPRYAKARALRLSRNERRGDIDGARGARRKVRDARTASAPQRAGPTRDPPNQTAPFMNPIASTAARRDAIRNAQVAARASCRRRQETIRADGREARTLICHAGERSRASDAIFVLRDARGFSILSAARECAQWRARGVRIRAQRCARLHPRRKSAFC